MTALQVTKKLNEQQAIIQKEKGEKINAEEKLSYRIKFILQWLKLLIC